MRRRTALASLAGSFALAGCLGSSQEPSEDSTPEPTDTPTPSPTPEPESPIDEDRIHAEYSSTDGEDYFALGWVQSNDVSVVDPETEERRSVTASNGLFFQSQLMLPTDIEFDLEEIELITIPEGNRYQPIEELPDGTPLSHIQDVGEHTLEPHSATEMSATGFLDPIYDIPDDRDSGKSAVDISTLLPETDSPRYLAR